MAGYVVLKCPGEDRINLALPLHYAAPEPHYICAQFAPEEGEQVVFVDEAGEVVIIEGPSDNVGELVAAVELRDPTGRITQYVS
jgi:hypothetical protein